MQSPSQYPVITDAPSLTDAEIRAFFDDIDTDHDAVITFAELEAKLHQVHKELAPEPQKHHLVHPERRDLENNTSHGGDGLHAFLCSILPIHDTTLDLPTFTQHVKNWNVPSQTQSDSGAQDVATIAQGRRRPLRRRLRAYWAVRGPKILFISFVVACLAGIGAWQMGIYIANPAARAALGWGVIVAKASAGVLYPTLVFMLLSMSRHLATFLRRFYGLGRVVNWDRSQTFHIIMSCIGLGFASLHAIGHLTGSMLYGSRRGQGRDVAAYLGPDAVNAQGYRPYAWYIRSLPGWSGITALLLFWSIALLSMPVVRKWSYEVFQLGHLLMFPLVGLLSAHGTAALLQAPMMGYWLAFPALLVLFERVWRVFQGFRSLPARMTILDDDAVAIAVRHPKDRDWNYRAGQYVFLQVPTISRWQWHPFTISSCRGSELQVHIKMEGDWTQALRDRTPVDTEIKVGVDGPFGAPAQRFYDYDYSIIVGGGIGITPFSAILTDLEENFLQQRDPWAEKRKSFSRSSSRRQSVHSSEIQSETPPRGPPERRVDFHWTVREKNNFLWFSDLLNRAITRAEMADHHKLELNINTHITAKRKNISTYVFRYILDGYRTDAAPYSALTGLKQRSHFGRPDFDDVLQRHFQDLVAGGIEEKKVGVFVSVVRP